MALSSLPFKSFGSPEAHTEYAAPGTEQLDVLGWAKKGVLKSDVVPLTHRQQPSDVASLAPIQYESLNSALTATYSWLEEKVAKYPAQPFALAASAAVFAVAKSTGPLTNW
jgi:hypothetical protein